MQVRNRRIRRRRLRNLFATVTVISSLFDFRTFAPGPPAAPVEGEANESTSVLSACVTNERYIFYINHTIVKTKQSDKKLLVEILNELKKHRLNGDDYEQIVSESLSQLTTYGESQIGLGFNMAFALKERPVNSGVSFGAGETIGHKGAKEVTALLLGPVLAGGCYYRC